MEKPECHWQVCVHYSASSDIVCEDCFRRPDLVDRFEVKKLENKDE
jgi:hypothetical protein